MSDHEQLSPHEFFLSLSHEFIDNKFDLDGTNTENIPNPSVAADVEKEKSDEVVPELVHNPLKRLLVGACQRRYAECGRKLPVSVEFVPLLIVVEKFERNVSMGTTVQLNDTIVN